MTWVVADSPVSGSVVMREIEARFDVLKPVRMLTPWKVVVDEIWLMVVRMDWAWSVLALRSSWVVDPVLALVTVRASSSMRRSDMTERPPSWAPREVDSR